METSDNPLIRDLAAQYAEICAQNEQNERRDLWRKHNSLKKTRVPILCSWYWGSNVADSLLDDQMRCVDPFLRGYERTLRNMIFHNSLGDDHVFEPWITVRAVHKLADECKNGDTWGIHYHRQVRAESQAWLIDPAIFNLDQARQMVTTPHQIDEAATTAQAAKLHDIIGDILPININRAPFYQCYGGSDLCEALGYLVGIENLMLYVHDKPELIHWIVAFMRDAVIAQYDQAEAAGDWSLTNNFNMGMPFCEELPDPSPNSHGAKMKDLWLFTCAQAFTLISPRMFEEFMLDYQMPIMKKFGLISYACCEDMTHKIGVLRKVPNLRRIGVTPVANVRKCAQQIGTDYVLSWKPNPAMIACGFDEDNIRKTIRAGLEDSRGCVVDIMLKDVTTLEGEAWRLKRWMEIVRDVADDFA
jgi:hypothetical protein